jgi:hypothetical protein
MCMQIDRCLFARRPLAISLALLTFSLATVPFCHAQKQKDDASGYDKSSRATVLHEAIVYLAPDETSGHVATVIPGHEVVIVERSGPWVRVFANIDVQDKTNDEEEMGEEEVATPASGWLHDQGVVSPATPQGDRILFGAAALYEDAAAQPNAPKNSVVEAHLLYRRVADYFPQSPLAGQAAFRSADIRWQSDRRDQSTLPSAHEQDADLRRPLYEGDMRGVMKTFPGSRWAAMAAYDLLDNKLCGDWQGLPKCPEQESKLYEKYAEQFPASPRAAEALYDATYRQGVLVTMYQVDEDRKHSEAAKAHTTALAQQMQQRFPDSDWTLKAQAVAYRVQQGIPIYGNDRD